MQFAEMYNRDVGSTRTGNDRSDRDHRPDHHGRVHAHRERPDILDQTPDAYVEVSASETGLHLFGYGHVEKGRRIRRDDGTHIEVYGTGRYIALAVRPYRNAPNLLGDLTDLTGDLSQLPSSSDSR